ncbi:hypothetical protein LGQ03_07150 [Loktanella sp. TSTF-M6]|uniref:Uncharacterized protein n=1 Tax=Loktanella gaetbuli TaxID=2881335 RepID=A0ABS8BTP1_9RHOB|nr:hypothetical protein [Loktanella gaetbuli]MCB5199012.1 hypothetical protein [Loktanella gaetbuli]
MNNLICALHRSRSLVLICVAILAYSAWPELIGRLQQERIVRDVFAMTPFRAVTVTQQIALPDRIVSMGDMVKVQCDFDWLTGYITFDDGSRERVRVDTTVEDTIRQPGNRPPMPEAQAWGPWSLTVREPLPIEGARPEPVWWDIFAAHKDCPFGPDRQINHFAGGPWRSSSLE